MLCCSSIRRGSWEARCVPRRRARDGFGDVILTTKIRCIAIFAAQPMRRMMSVDDPYTELPDDPEGAFVHLEKHYRQALHEKLEASQSGNAGDSYWIEYMNRTLAAAQELGISALAEWTVPSHTDTSSRIYDRWQNFTTAVENYTTRLAIKNSRRQRSHSIAFDHATKQKIRHYLDKIKEIVDNLRISEQKKEKIYARINALADEVDRNRTRFDAAMALSVEAASTGGT